MSKKETGTQWFINHLTQVHATTTAMQSTSSDKQVLNNKAFQRNDKYVQH